MVGDTPVALIKTGKKSDFMTAEEIVEDIYQRPVDHIVFKDHEAS
jgi:exoribonuclease II